MDGKAHSFELMEPASPEALVPDYGLWPWYLAAGFAALVILALVFLSKKRKTTINPQSIRNAAFEEASAALSAMTTETPRDAAVRASLVLRRYLSAAARDPALFETHEEFVGRRESLKELNADARAAADAGFTRLAALKYAPEIPAAAPQEVIGDSRALLETLHRGFTA
jgi:LPXTG-motif cell wall-anchored protein